MHITEVVTQGGGITRWFTGTMRYTVKEQKALTKRARAILADAARASAQPSGALPPVAADSPNCDITSPVRAHINHSYGASVLLVPLVVTNRRLLPWWVGFVTIQAAAHLATYGIGTPLLLPPESAFVAYPHAVDLIDQIRTLPAYTRPGTILVLQTSVNAWLSQSISPTAVAVLSLGTCACAVGLLRELVAGLSPRAARGRPENCVEH